MTDEIGMKKIRSCHYQYLSPRGACGKPLAVSLNRQPK